MNFNISFAGRGPAAGAAGAAAGDGGPRRDAGYFSTIGIPLKRGRVFTSDDREGTPRVALMTESAARQYFPNEDPIGKTIKLGWGKGGPAAEPAGRSSASSATSRTTGWTKPSSPEIYLPFRQWPVSLMSVVIRRRRRRPRRLAEAVRAARCTPSIRTCRSRASGRSIRSSRSRSRSRASTCCCSAIFAAVALVAGGDRHLRRAVVRGRPANARDRHPDGARRAGRHRRAASWCVRR